MHIKCWIITLISEIRRFMVAVVHYLHILCPNTHATIIASLKTTLLFSHFLLSMWCFDQALNQGHAEQSVGLTLLHVPPYCRDHKQLCNGI